MSKRERATRGDAGMEEDSKEAEASPNKKVNPDKEPDHLATLHNNQGETKGKMDKSLSEVRALTKNWDEQDRHNKQQKHASVGESGRVPNNHAAARRRSSRPQFPLHKFSDHRNSDEARHTIAVVTSSKTRQEFPHEKFGCATVRCRSIATGVVDAEPGAFPADGPTTEEPTIVVPGILDEDQEEEESPENSVDQPMVEATLVVDPEIQLPSEQEIPQAEVVDPKSAKRRQIVVFLLALLGLITGATIGGVCGSGMCSSSGQQQEDDMMLMGQSNPVHIYNSTLFTLPQYTIQSLQNQSSAQFQAYQWLRNNFADSAFLGLEDWRKNQLFVIMTLYYSFDWPEDQIEPSPFGSECDWTKATYFQKINCRLESASCTDQDWRGGFCEVGIVTSLEFGYLTGGTVPQEIELIPGLKRFALCNSTLNTTLHKLLPSNIGKLENLGELHIEYNQLDGSFPAVLGELTALSSLSLAGNQLEGSIPSELGMLTGLTALQLDHNEFTLLPTELGLLTKLASNITDLQLNNNNLLALPSEIGIFTACTSLSIHSNNIRERIPSQAGRLTNLAVLTMDFQSLAMATALTGLTGLHLLFLLSGNKFTDEQVEVFGIDHRVGTIPPELGLFSNLLKVTFDYGVTGTIPSQLGNLASLRLWSFRVWLHELSGTIPTDIGRLSALQFLNLPAERLSGTLPSELGLLSALGDLNLGGNLLTGSIPSELGLLSNLELLMLQEMNLNGRIPSELGALEKLTNLSLRRNLLSGALPSTLGRLFNLRGLDLSYNWLQGTIPTQLSQLGKMIPRPPGTMFTQAVTNMYLDLGHNSLNGTIPSEIALLTDLRELGLQGNQITGTVPMELLMLDLEELELQDNNISGSLSELVQPFKSGVLKVYGNDLTGTVPETICSRGLLQVFVDCVEDPPTCVEPCPKCICVESRDDDRYWK